MSKPLNNSIQDFDYQNSYNYRDFMLEPFKINIVGMFKENIRKQQRYPY